MKIFKQIAYCILYVSLFTACGDDKTDEIEPIKPKEYQLVWEDNFDGTSLDATKWNCEVNGYGGGNNELQYYTDRPQNVRLADGNLIIEARKEQYVGKEYTSARITTKAKAEFTYGKIEARISVPSGKGTWAAFWMLGAEGRWPMCGEIDIMEHIGSEPNMLSHALHTNNRNGGAAWNVRKYYPDSMENEFHTYKIEWIENLEENEDWIKFYIDDVETAYKYQTSNDISEWPFDKNFYVILNLAIGGSWGGVVDNDIFNKPIIMKVDYVRVYQKR